MTRWHALCTWEGSEIRAAEAVTRHRLADAIVLPMTETAGPRGPVRAALIEGYLVIGSAAEPDWPALTRVPGVTAPLALVPSAGPSRLSEADVGRLHVLETLDRIERSEQRRAAAVDARAVARQRRRRPRRSRRARAA